jgi:hypothetical protein
MGLIMKTTSSNIPKTNPYSVAEAPFFSAYIINDETDERAFNINRIILLEYHVYYKYNYK